MTMFGSKEKFAISIDWATPPFTGLPDAAEVATWCDIGFFANNVCLTTNRPEASNEVRESIQWHALTIAEWLVEHWERVLFESKPPLPVAAIDGVLLLRRINEGLATMQGCRAEELAERRRIWWAAHSIRGGRQGAAFPDVIFWPQGNQVSVSWQPDNKPFGLSNTMFTFIERGHTKVSLADLIATFRNFLRGVVARLDEKEVVSPRVQSLKAKAGRIFDSRLNRETLQVYLGLNDKAVAAVFGVGPKEFQGLFQESAHGEQIKALFQEHLGIDYPLVENLEDLTLSTPIALYRCVSPTVSETDVNELKRIWNKCKPRKGKKDVSKLRALQIKCSQVYDAGSSQVPHVIGGQKARIVRKALRLPSDTAVEIESILTEMLNVPIDSCQLEDVTIDAVSLWDKNSDPAVFINRKSLMGRKKWGRRMALAHELCHLIFDASEGKSLGIASGRWAPVELEQCANAFAAEILLPSSALERDAISLSEGKNFDKLMNQFKVGATTAANRLRDLGIIDEPVFNNLISKHSTKY